jgi:hypothetical protein
VSVTSTPAATLQAAAGADGNGTAFDINGARRVTVQVSGTFSATVNFEGTIDNTNWFAVGLKTAADGAAVTTTTGAGVWKRTPDLALSQIRARISGWASGTVTVTALKE